MTFRPIPCRSRWEGAMIAFWIVLLDLLILIWMLRRPVDWQKFAMILLVAISIPLFIHILSRVWIAFTLDYWVDRNAVTVVYANTRQIIPLDAIRRIISHGVVAIDEPTMLQRYWPAPYVRPARAAGLANLTMLATRPLEECLIIDTGDACFALSPEKSQAFIEAVQERHSLGPVLQLKLSSTRTPLLDRYIGADSIGAWLLVAGMIGVLILFGFLMVQFPNLPDALAFHYNSDGLPDVVREKSALFLLPAIGLLAWLINGLWGIWMATHNQRTGAYLLWGGALIVQACSLLALHSLMY
jgi:hypothetical protein